MSGILRFVTEPRYSGYFFSFALFLFYGAAPFSIFWFVDANPYMFSLGLMSCLAAVLVVAGFHLPIFDALVSGHRFRLPIPLTIFQIIVWGGFLVFFAVTVATADAVPLISALSGGSTAEVLDAQRGAFLKTREGWESSLVYIGGVFAGLLLPFALSLLLVYRMRGRFIALAVFIIYSLSFLQKALFIQAVVPPAYLAARRQIWNYLGLFALLVGSASLLYVNTILARGVQEPEAIERIIEQRTEAQQEAVEVSVESGQQHTKPIFPPGFFSANFTPVSSGEHLIWRAVGVPIFTAADAIKVFDQRFHGEHLYGSTSSFIAKIFQMERVNFDAEVYASQWGRTEVGRANSVYVTEAFVNFGWAGVALFSLLVGLAFRVLALSENEAIRSVWPLFAYNIIQAGLIGTLLSSGFVLIFIFALFARFVPPGSSQQAGERRVEPLSNAVEDRIRIS